MVSGVISDPTALKCVRFFLSVRATHLYMLAPKRNLGVKFDPKTIKCTISEDPLPRLKGGPKDMEPIVLLLTYQVFSVSRIVFKSWNYGHN